MAGWKGLFEESVPDEKGTSKKKVEEKLDETICVDCEQLFPISNLKKYKGKYYCQGCLALKREEEIQAKHIKEVPKEQDFSELKNFFKEEISGLRTEFEMIKDQLLIILKNQGTKNELPFPIDNTVIPETIVNGLIMDKIKYAIQKIPLTEFGYEEIIQVYEYLFNKWTPGETLRRYIRILVEKRFLKRVIGGIFTLVKTD